MSQIIGDKLPAEIIKHGFKGGHIPCKYWHHHSCEWDAFTRFFIVFKQAAMFYGPIHCIPVILFKLKKLAKDPKSVIFGLIKNISKSCLFLATYMTIFKYGLCFWKNLFQNGSAVNVALSAAFSFPGLRWEQAGRRTEMSLYFLSPTLEMIYNWLVKWGYFTPIKHGEVYLFSLTMAIIMYCYQYHPDVIKNMYRGIFKSLWGEN